MAKSKKATFAPVVVDDTPRPSKKELEQALAVERARTQGDLPSLFQRDPARVNRRVMRLSTSRRKHAARGARNRQALAAE